MNDILPYHIEVEAQAFYVAEQSNIIEDRYVFNYRIRIANLGSVPATLLSRHWIIRDADNDVQEVRGDGVVGEQPMIEPGEVFEYTSGVGLETPVATMQGSYRMRASDGTEFDAEIPEFVLSIPRILH